MIFFTADHHFGHANIIRHCNRLFTSAAEMDASLLKTWNNCVGQHDTVYILGDLFFRNSVPVQDYLEKMSGRKHLIVGNHDKYWVKRVDLSRYFESVSHMLEFSDGSSRITLCHYPMMTWNGVAKGSYMIHGHIHNKTDAAYFEVIRSMPNLLNAGVDVNNNRPVTLKELLINNQKFKAES